MYTVIIVGQGNDPSSRLLLVILLLVILMEMDRMMSFIDYGPGTGTWVRMNNGTEVKAARRYLQKP